MIKNNTELNATYDIVYWKKLRVLKKLIEIEQRLQTVFPSNVCHKKQKNINILSLHKPNEAVKNR